jgi:hypothetical protein
MVMASDFEDSNAVSARVKAGKVAGLRVASQRVCRK